MNNIFENAKFGDKFVCRNGTIAYYGRYSEKEDKHFLLVNDSENDYIVPYSDGHLFHVDEEDKLIDKGPHKGKTTYEVYGWDKEEMRNHRLDIVSHYQEPIDEKELDKLALNIYSMCGETPECLIPPEHPNKEIYDWMTKCFNVMIWGIKLGYKKAKEE